ncbi:hypothetical protein HVPorG_04645 [Roseomonas mucosa]|nr:hypothetical protein HVPorG_04645 [Roseomonas mucosa]UZO98830.1 hypothetical protein RMHFA_04645 [Roseomonas mucosa]
MRAGGTLTRAGSFGDRPFVYWPACRACLSFVHRRFRVEGRSYSLHD